MNIKLMGKRSGLKVWLVTGIILIAISAAFIPLMVTLYPMAFHFLIFAIPGIYAIIKAILISRFSVNLIYIDDKAIYFKKKKGGTKINFNDCLSVKCMFDVHVSSGTKYHGPQFFGFFYSGKIKVCFKGGKVYTQKYIENLDEVYEELKTIPDLNLQTNYKQ